MVPEPEANLGLVQDCETLSGMRHMLVIRAGDSAYQSHRALNWSARTPITEWERLTIALPGEDSSLSNELRSGLRATELDLSDAIFRGAIPPEIGYLSALESLDLSQSRLEGPIPAELSNLSALKFLNLNNNDLEGVIPAELGNLSALEFLGLRDNKLEGSIPPELGDLSNLRDVDLIGNEISGCIPGGLDKQLVPCNEPDLFSRGPGSAARPQRAIRTRRAWRTYWSEACAIDPG